MDNRDRAVLCWLVCGIVPLHLAWYIIYHIIPYRNAPAPVSESKDTALLAV